jgi:glycosyltransferase involved in cell wall biosynthesis
MALSLVLDGCCLGRRKTGNETYIRCLLEKFARLRFTNLDLTVLTTTHYTGPRSDCFQWENIPLGNFATRNFYTIPRQLSQRAPDLYHATYWTRFWSQPVPSLVMIHDISFVSFPQGFKTHERLFYAGVIKAIAQQARHILTVSEFSKQDLIERWHLPPEKITVTYEAVEDCFRPADHPTAPTLSAPYLLYVGNLHPRKNLVRLLQAFVQLKQAHRIPHRLKIVGQKAWLFGEIFETVRRHCLEQDVDFTGYVSQEELIQLYQQATVTAYPSLFEGFGFPVLEAMACGSPVVTSATTSIPEVAGDAAILVDPHSSEAIAEGLRQVLLSPERQQDLKKRGLEQVKKFSWERCARQTYAVYEKLIQG